MGMTRLAMSVPILAILALAMVPALAAGSSCPAMAVEAEPPVRALWPDVTERVREAFEARADIDGCARVRLSTRGKRIEVEVLLKDGRAATRSVSRREDVVPTLAALLLVPEPPAPLPQAEPADLPPPSPPTAAASAQPAPPAPTRRDSPAPPPPQPLAAAQAGVGVEFSIATGARVGDGQAGLGIGVRSFLDVVSWLVGFEGRVDGYKTLDGRRSAEVLELALRAGRRFRYGTLALDVTAGPALALMGSTSTSAVNAEDAPKLPASEPESTHGLTPRVLVGAQLNLSTDAVVRWFVGVDGEFGATHGLGDVLPSHVPRLPSWTVGLALGATVGTL